MAGLGQGCARLIHRTGFRSHIAVCGRPEVDPTPRRITFIEGGCTTSTSISASDGYDVAMYSYHITLPDAQGGAVSAVLPQKQTP